MATIEAKTGLEHGGSAEAVEELPDLAPEVQLALEIFARRSELRAMMRQVDTKLSASEERARQHALRVEFDKLSEDVGALCVANHKSDS